ncbi:invasion associated locus B family protein [Microvirga sp. W0021]|uniref:Invasion associated locus B family protein n=1 Tax=Hohaiivirga grylli TaxID=3133970 RepID=A0ABV0BHD8_9HYPH
MGGRFLLAVPFALMSMMPAVAQQTSNTNTSSAFDAWVLGCASRTDKDKVIKACEIRSTIVVRDEKNNQQGVAAVIGLGRSVEKDDLQFIIQVPINALLNTPVKILNKDDKTVVELPFIACQVQPPLCTATVTATDMQISMMKKVGENYFISYRNHAGQDVKIQGSTKGFNKALDALLKEK